MELTIYTGASQLELPVRPPDPEDEELTPFEPPERGPQPRHTPLEMAQSQRMVELDLTTEETIYTTYGDGGDFDGAALTRIDDIDLTLGYTMRKEFRINETDPLAARAAIEQKTVFKRGDWSVRIECRTALSSDGGNFRLQATLEAWEGGERIFERAWDEAIPRQML